MSFATNFQHHHSLTNTVFSLRRRTPSIVRESHTTRLKSSRCLSPHVSFIWNSNRRVVYTFKVCTNRLSAFMMQRHRKISTVRLYEPDCINLHFLAVTVTYSKFFLRQQNKSWCWMITVHLRHSALHRKNWQGFDQQITIKLTIQWSLDQKSVRGFAY